MPTKLTNRTLKQIIREEISRVLSEANGVPWCSPGTPGCPERPHTHAPPEVPDPSPAGRPRRRRRRRRRRARKSKCNPQMKPCKTPEECAKRSEQATQGLYKLIKQFPEGNGAKDWRVIQYNHDQGANALQVITKAICYAEKAVKFWESHRKYACSELGSLYDTPAGDGMPFSPGRKNCYDRVKALKRRIEDLRHNERSMITVDSDLGAMEHLRDWPDDIKTPKGQVKADAEKEKKRKAAILQRLGL